ncbi:nucleoid-associated protein [Acetobacterium fimetarium]|uniref:Nucleoid-associated protein n=1 Tax=Acetobacterium fimetarium TaxID=52691 RepID=A0ABR6WZ12_9FIRM|nr:nucleoid-associated protein [Acetobacterium fimetarium]MBC3805585.1 nucleoid-associated protein [Acetobacterium fimetarium]
MNIEITINKSILHVLDTNASIPVLSDTLLNMTLTVKDYIEKHVQRSIKDPEIKRTVFRTGSKFKERLQDYKSNPHELVRVSAEIAQMFFDYMIENIEIPSADLVFVDFEMEHETYLGIFKFNYKHGYIHYVNTDNGLTNDILVQPCVLPNESQKLDEFVLINLATDEILLKEKKYLISNEKDFYISTQLLHCEPAISEKEAFDIVEKTAKDMIGKEYGRDYEKLNAIKTVLADDYEAEREIDIENIAKVVFDGDESVQEKFKETLEQKGLYDKKVQVSPNIEKKIFGKQKFITDTGIEISIPTEQLKRNDIVEFKNNPDGTISVEIKNIGLLNHK